MESTESMASSNDRCRIVVVDDHAIMRDGLCAILGNEPDLEVVGVADNGKGAIDEAGRHAPDLVVIDLSMPRTDGAQAIRVIKSRYPDIGVVVLTYHKEEAHIHSALDAGADAYVLKDDGRGDLLAAIRNVSAGRSYLSPAICDRVMSGYVRSGAPGGAEQSSSWEALTAREQEVLKLVAEGYKTREIADYLSLSEKTIEKHRANMMRKLDLHGVSAVTAYAIENGLVAH
jgi:DNA-binding NarL/FixJ family response regulator